MTMKLKTQVDEINVNNGVIGTTLADGTTVINSVDTLKTAVNEQLAGLTASGVMSTKYDAENIKGFNNKNDSWFQALMWFVFSIQIYPVEICAYYSGIRTGEFNN